MTTLFRGVLFVAHKGEWWCLFEICSQLLATLGGDITDDHFVHWKQGKETWNDSRLATRARLAEARRER